jgi:hypothetical protein
VGTRRADPWTADDVERAEHVYSQLSKKAASCPISSWTTRRKGWQGDYLAEQFDLGNRFGVAHTFAWPGRDSAAVGQEFPVGWETRGKYLMTSEWPPLSESRPLIGRIGR